MKNVIIEVNSSNSYVDLGRNVLGLNKENLQGKIIFNFKDRFVDGIAWLEMEKPDGTKGYVAMTKEEETYVLPILSSLLDKEGEIRLQLRITEEETPDGIPVFKSNVFYLYVEEALNTTTEIPEEYPSWLDIADNKLLEIENINIQTEKVGNVATVTVTNKDKSEQSFELHDGEKGDKGDKGDDGLDGKDGKDGEDAKINGYNTIEIEAGKNITINQQDNKLTISSEAGGSTQELEEEIEEIRNDLLNYSLTSETGNKIALSVDPADYVMTLSLKDKNNNVLSTQTVDLPLETMVVDAEYDNDNKSIILTLQNGNTTSFSVADLVSGLVSTSSLEETLSDYALDELTFDGQTYTIQGGFVELINEFAEALQQLYDDKQDNITSENKLSYDLISGTPTIPTQTSQLTNNSGFITSTEVDNKISQAITGALEAEY